MEEHSEETHSCFNHKLFQLGYNRRVYGPDNIRDIFKNPGRDYRPDMIPDLDDRLLSNPYVEGKQQRKGDMPYSLSAGVIAGRLGNIEIKVE